MNSGIDLLQFSLNLPSTFRKIIEFPYKIGFLEVSQIERERLARDIKVFSKRGKVCHLSGIVHENAQEPLEDRNLLDPEKLGDVPIDDLINDAFLDILLDDLLVVDPDELGESLGLQEFAEKSLQLSGEKSGGN